MRFISHVVRLCSVILCLLSSLPLRSSAKSDDLGNLFGFDQIHTVNLIFAADQWDAIKPNEPARSPGGPGGPGGRGRGPFNPGGMLVEGFRRALDGDKSGSISKHDSLAALHGSSMGHQKQGFLDVDALREG